MKENQKTLEVWKEEIQKMDEVSLFVTIDNFGLLIWRESCNFAEGRIKISETMFLEHQNYHVTVVNLCICKLSDFGVNFQSDKPCSESDSYMEWYEFWKDWKNSFSDGDWKKIQNKLQEGQSIQEYLPKVKWNQEDNTAKKLKEKCNELDLFLKTDETAGQILSLYAGGWSNEEILSIIAHFMSGGMVADIFDPAINAKTTESIKDSKDALMDFARFFCSKVENIPGLKNELGSIWAENQIKNKKCE